MTYRYLSTLIWSSKITVTSKCWNKKLLNILNNDYILENQCVLYTTDNQSQFETQTWRICQTCQHCKNFVLFTRNSSEVILTMKFTVCHSLRLFKKILKSPICLNFSSLEIETKWKWSPSLDLRFVCSVSS